MHKQDDTTLLLSDIQEVKQDDVVKSGWEVVLFRESWQEGPLWDLNDKGGQSIVCPHSIVHLGISKHTNSITQVLSGLTINF